jgi:hypothetical protein
MINFQAVEYHHFIFKKFQNNEENYFSEGQMEEQ